MRIRLTVVLVALLAIIVVPSEAALAEQAGSVIDQVSSCTQASGLAREVAPDGGGVCSPRVPLAATLGALAMLLGMLSAAAPGVVDRQTRRDERWRRPEVVARAGAPWRAPPVAP